MVFGLLVKAQDRKVDAANIEKQVDAMVNSWNKHDHSDMKNYTTLDCEWINIVGMWWKNAKEVEFATQAYHNTMFKYTPMAKKKVTVSFLSDDVALVHFLSRLGSFVTPDGKSKPAGDNLATLIYVKKSGTWLLRAGENVEIDTIANKFDPVKLMPRN